MKIGYSKYDITPAAGSPLAGRPMLVARTAKVVRDHLYARALRIVSDSEEVTLMAVDLLLVTKGLHSAVAREAGLPPERLLIFATHTHSAFGGFWRGRLAESFMGRFREETRSGLVKSLARAATEAARVLEPAELSAASLRLCGRSENRRKVDGDVDPALTFLTFKTAVAQPVCIASFGAHPISGLEREPFTMTADYPGEVCRRLETHGMRTLFLQGACGGTSSTWRGQSLEEHLRFMGEGIEDAWAAARLDAQRHEVGAISLSTIPMHVRPRMDNDHLSATFLRLGRVGLVGVPGEIGPQVSLEARRLLQNAGLETVITASLCNGYAGYIHTRQDYMRRPTTLLALYENVMSLAGRDAGDALLSALSSLRGP